jgi:hypothetical protein
MIEEYEPTIIRQYWAYRHISGHIHVKRYDSEFSQETVDLAFESDFTTDVIGPYAAENRKDAERIAVEKLGAQP